MPQAIDIPMPPAPPAARQPGQVTREYKISLATPMFGGGAEAARPDETMPIRGTTIRGQLQFWWRATRGAAFTTHEELFARHKEIWGTTDRASPVAIGVRNVTAKPARPCAQYEWNPQARGGEGAWRLAWGSPFGGSSLPYALFPFQGKQPQGQGPQGEPEEAPARFIDAASFILRVRYPQRIQQEVDTAVWAWVNFGGLGARTRRGCGALLCDELAPKEVGDVERWFRAGRSRGPADVHAWPTLPPEMLVGGKPEGPLDAWKKVVGLLKEFRQDVGVARNPGQQPNRPGRSRYPEPETIREVTHRRSPKHGRLSRIPNNAFPRAEFGLPIIFHFQGQGEPQDTVLYPQATPNGEVPDRMASPLVLKPLALSNGKAVPLVLQLVTPPLKGVVLKQMKPILTLPLPSSTVIRDARLATYEGSPLSRSPSGSALAAFLQHTSRSSNDFRKVTA